MKKFLRKFLLIIGSVILINLLLGLIRLMVDDRNIPYIINQKENTMVLDYEKKESFYSEKQFAVSNLSRDTLYSITKTRDAYGFSNAMENKNPELLFIGDSYFYDTHISTNEGLQASCNKMLGGNISYNLGSVDNSNFKVYNELLQAKYITKPKVIVMEILEEYLHTWLDLKNQIENNSIKTQNVNYYGLDLVFGNNFSNWKDSKIFPDNRTLKSGISREIDGETIHFLRGTQKKFSANEIDSLVKVLKYVQQHFEKQNTKIIFILVPNKESLYPNLFGKSQFEEIQKSWENNKIKHINLFSYFWQNPFQYYFKGDTHWNKNATDLLLRKLYELEEIKSLERKDILQ